MHSILLNKYQYTTLGVLCYNYSHKYNKEPPKVLEPSKGGVSLGGAKGLGDRTTVSWWMTTDSCHVRPVRLFGSVRYVEQTLITNMAIAAAKERTETVTRGICEPNTAFSCEHIG